jgi:hypothetical protein
MQREKPLALTVETGGKRNSLLILAPKSDGRAALELGRTHARRFDFFLFFVTLPAEFFLPAALRAVDDLVRLADLLEATVFLAFFADFLADFFTAFFAFLADFLAVFLAVRFCAFAGLVTCFATCLTDVGTRRFIRSATDFTAASANRPAA